MLFKSFLPNMTQDSSHWANLKRNNLSRKMTYHTPLEIQDIRPGRYGRTGFKFMRLWDGNAMRPHTVAQRRRHCLWSPKWRLCTSGEIKQTKPPLKRQTRSMMQCQNPRCTVPFPKVVEIPDGIVVFHDLSMSLYEMEVNQAVSTRWSKASPPTILGEDQLPRHCLSSHGGFLTHNSELIVHVIQVRTMVDFALTMRLMHIFQWPLQMVQETIQILHIWSLTFHHYYKQPWNHAVYTLLHHSMSISQLPWTINFHTSTT